MDKMPFDHLRQLWLSIKEKPKMKDDHIACLPYACLLGENILPARRQCIVVGRNTPKPGFPL
jgi:hypothetical protein